jgi:hypothetical protein
MSTYVRRLMMRMRYASDLNHHTRSYSYMQTMKTPNTPTNLPPQIEITRLPTSNSSHTVSTHTTYHIYNIKDRYTTISTSADAPKNRFFGPITKKAREISTNDNDTEPTFFLHKPHLAFHKPPHVLYAGASKHSALPTALIHSTCFWRSYKLQLGPSLASLGVLDPRGVVPWKHNGGDAKTLKRDNTLLKGYKVRSWRLWGESGKSYTRSINTLRKYSSGTGNGEGDGNGDPDIVPPTHSPVHVNEVVNLSWTSPFSRHTRRYHFLFRGMDFYWKGTGTVNESKQCGVFLRFNHLKLVVKAPEEHGHEVCLGKYTSSVAKKKRGVLELFDGAMIRFSEEYALGLLEGRSDDGKSEDGVVEDGVEDRIVRLKKSTWYQIIVATAICMIASEKEKRHTLIDILMHAAEGGGGGGGGG